MMLDSFGLICAYVVLAGLLVAMLFYSNWPFLIKTLMVFIVSGFFYITYYSIPDFFGWPTAHHRPDKLQIVAIYIDAPNKIYLWGHDMDQGIAGTRPRAYEFNYTTALNNSLNKASNKLKKGFPMIGEFRPPSGVRQVGEGMPLEKPDDFDLIIYDVPEGLVPNAEK